MHLGEVGVRQGLLHCDALGRVKLQHFLHQVNCQVACVREHHPEGAPLQVHMSISQQAVTNSDK